MNFLIAVDDLHNTYDKTYIHEGIESQRDLNDADGNYVHVINDDDEDDEDDEDDGNNSFRTTMIVKNIVETLKSTARQIHEAFFENKRFNRDLRDSHHHHTTPHHTTSHHITPYHTTPHHTVTVHVLFMTKRYPH